MLFALAILWLSVFWGTCDKMSPKPGLKLFQDDYKSVEETCIAVGFVKIAAEMKQKWVFTLFTLSLLCIKRLSLSEWSS